MSTIDPHTRPCLPSPDTAQARAAVRWLQLGVLALAIAGLFAILLVISRSPGMEQFFPWIDFFRTALVVHVDQSVLIWFLAMAGLFWSLSADSERGAKPFAGLAFMLAIAGTLGIAVAAFIGDGAPLMNNYVPVLQRPVFFVSLGLFALGITVLLILDWVNSPWKEILSDRNSVFQVGTLTINIAVAMSILALFWSWFEIPADMNGVAFYEFLFWGAGHTLQFAYAQLMMLAWVCLACAVGTQLPVGDKAIKALLLAGVAPVLLVPVIYILYPAVSDQAHLAFTRLMQYGGGLATVPVGMLLIVALFKPLRPSDVQRPLKRSLVMSIVLFGAGGLIGISISGVNTIIPAHYHGSIVGVTLALMGFAYLVIPRLGYAPVTGRLANIQPIVYGVGQLLHISGLALSGALGVQRKTAGAAQGLDNLSAKLTMGIMGIGGLLAVIGGILFVWVMFRAFLRGTDDR